MKKVTVKILCGCRIDGVSRQAGKTYQVSEDGAKLACGAGRATYSAPAKKQAKASGDK